MKSTCMLQQTIEFSGLGFFLSSFQFPNESFLKSAEFILQKKRGEMIKKPFNEQLIHYLFNNQFEIIQ